MTTEATTSIVPTSLSTNEPSFIVSTNRKVNATMRGFFGTLMEPFIDAIAKVKKTLGGHEEVSTKTLHLVDGVMALRTGMSEAANNPDFKRVSKSQQ